MNRLLDRPRLFGLLCAAVAVALGLAYLKAAGAPSGYLAINAAAVILGAGAWLAIGLWQCANPARVGQMVLALALPLVATALFGVAIEGAARWIFIGSLSVQISLLVVPAIIVLYARSADAIGTAGVAVAAFALAAQPDRAMAGVLAAGMLAVVLGNRSRPPALALAAAGSAFGISIIRPDALPAVPFVDGILYSAFDVHPTAGVAVVAGTLVMLAPVLLAARGDAHSRRVLAAFGLCWAAAVAAAALDSYPTPLVGYGGSAVLGYLISVALLPGSSQSDRPATPARPMPKPAANAGASPLPFSVVARG